MPELPEIVTLARDMQKELAGKTITGVEVLQPKCLNLPEEDFAALNGHGTGNLARGLKLPNLFPACVVDHVNESIRTAHGDLSIADSRGRLIVSAARDYVSQNPLLAFIDAREQTVTPLQFA